MWNLHNQDGIIRSGIDDIETEQLLIANEAARLGGDESIGTVWAENPDLAVRKTVHISFVEEEL